PVQGTARAEKLAASTPQRHRFERLHGSTGSASKAVPPAGIRDPRHRCAAGPTLAKVPDVRPLRRELSSRAVPPPIRGLRPHASWWREASMASALESVDPKEVCGACG